MRHWGLEEGGAGTPLGKVPIHCGPQCGWPSTQLVRACPTAAGWRWGGQKEALGVGWEEL